jgi:acetyltransferase-like isoleucine patch superfamily enzyme
MSGGILRFYRPWNAPWVMSAIRIISLKVRYRGRIEIGFDSYVGPRCQIYIAKGGRLRLRNVNVNRDVTVGVAPHAVVQVGPRGWLGPGSVVAAQQRVVLGEGSMIAEYVTIRDHDHVHDEHHPIEDWIYTTAPVIIGEGVWVGGKVTIAPGVAVGDHAFIAANAVVTHDVGANERVGGVPARPLPVRSPSAGEVSGRPEPAGPVRDKSF